MSAAGVDTRTVGRPKGALPDVIRGTTIRYARRGISARDMGDGWCSDFANDVLDQWIGTEWRHADGHGLFDQVETGQFWRHTPDFDPIDWDWDLLREHWGIKPPEGVASKTLRELVGPATHVWIATGGRHHDAEAPDGVASFFDLPFFQRWLA